MRVAIQYWEECPSHGEALARVRKVLEDENIHVKIELVRVESEEQAQRLHFVGSPTILVNDVDIDPPTTSHYGLTCRAYRLEDGRISPLPSEQMISRSIQKIKGNLKST